MALALSRDLEDSLKRQAVSLLRDVSRNGATTSLKVLFLFYVFVCFGLDTFFYFIISLHFVTCVIYNLQQDAIQCLTYLLPIVEQQEVLLTGKGRIPYNRLPEKAKRMVLFIFIFISLALF